MALLSVQDVVAGYDAGTVLKGVTLSVDATATVALLGRNGVGKTTTLRTIAGQLTPRSGEIRFDGEDITGDRPDEIYNCGLVMVPEDGGIFPDLTVGENLRVPIIRDPDDERTIAEIYDVFPELERLRSSKGRHLSGGEQQMLTIARALRSVPELLLLDEPSEGLAPKVVEKVKSIVETIEVEGTTVFLVEQNVDMALSLADHVYIMDDGRVVHEGTPDEIRAAEEEIEQYLGVHRT